MIRRQELGKVVTLVSCALFLTTAAQADGQPRGRAASPAAAPAAPSSWSGLYVGANAGYAWGGDDGASIAGNDPVFQSMFNGTAFPGGTSFARSRALDRDGLTGGVQVGYNWQVGSAWVVGVETDIQLGRFRRPRRNDRHHRCRAPRCRRHGQRHPGRRLVRHAARPRRRAGCQSCHALRDGRVGLWPYPRSGDLLGRRCGWRQCGRLLDPMPRRQYPVRGRPVNGALELTRLPPNRQLGTDPPHH